MAKGGDGHQQGSIAGIVLIRLFIGGFFLYSAITKLQAFPKFVAYLTAATGAGGAYVANNIWPAYAGFLQQTVHPHAQLYGILIVVGEVLAGTLLLLGLLTRLGGLIGLALSACYLLATMTRSAESLGLNAAFLVAELAVIIAAAGRTWGIDQAIAKRTKVKLLW